VEPFLHAGALLVPLSIGIVCLERKYFNPSTGDGAWCWLTDFPSGCSNDETVECLRGENILVFSACFGLSLFLLVFLTISGSMLLVLHHVYVRERALAKYIFAPAGTLDDIGARRNSNSSRKMKRTRHVSTQALLYSGACFLTIAPVLIRKFSGLQATRKNRTFFFVTGVFLNILYPLQGFWNCWI
jgi:hypothetical protein